MDTLDNIDALYGHRLGVRINEVLLHFSFVESSTIFLNGFIAQNSLFKFLTLSWVSCDLRSFVASCKFRSYNEILVKIFS